jgi:hypothetical protein
MNHIDTMRLALDALLGATKSMPTTPEEDKAITALNSALVEPSEPVYIRRDQLQKARRENYLCEVGPEPRADKVAIYSNPPVHQQLSDEEIKNLWFSTAKKIPHCAHYEHFAQAIEAAIRSKT